MDTANWGDRETIAETYLPLLPQVFLPLPVLPPTAAKVSLPEHNSDHTCFKPFRDFPLRLTRLKPQNSVHGPAVARKLSSFHSMPSLPSYGSLDRPQLLHTPGPLHMLFLPSQSQLSSHQLCPAFRSWLPCPFLCETSPWDAFHARPGSLSSGPSVSMWLFFRTPISVGYCTMHCIIITQHELLFNFSFVCKDKGSFHCIYYSFWSYLLQNLSDSMCSININ